MLTGNPAPDGAVIKPGAMEQTLLVHRARAVVFDATTIFPHASTDPALDVEPGSILVLRSAGPIGAPGFPEWGQLPIPKEAVAQGQCATWCESPMRA